MKSSKIIDTFETYHLSPYFATDTLLQVLNLLGVVELTSQLLILENILWLPLESNQ